MLSTRLLQTNKGQISGLAGASYDSISFGVSSQDGLPHSLFFKPAGAKMYLGGLSNDRIYQYSLSTPWSLSGASYDSVFFSVGAQDTTPIDFFFKSDGTKLYMLGSVNDTVYQYTLPTPWVLTGATYDSVSFSVTTQATLPIGIFFKSDGSKMYIMDNSTNSIYQYGLGTPWDLSTASYDSISLSVGAQEPNVDNLFFNSAGTNLYINGLSQIYQYVLGTPWDLSTASFLTSFSALAQLGGANCSGFSLKDDETKLYVVSSTTVDTIYQYTILP